MSRRINLQKIPRDILKQMTSDLILEIPPSKYAKNTPSTYIQLYDIDKTDPTIAYIPFAYTRPDNVVIKTPHRKDFKQLNVEFGGSLREPQYVVCENAIDILNRTSSAIISAYPGFGKTCSAIFIASKIKLPTLIICHRIVLVNQWMEAIQKFSNGTFQVVNPSDVLKDVDFYIMNAMNIPKNNRSFYERIGFVVIDECHLIMAESMSKCLSFLTPRYLLGLSATAYRNDGLDKLINLYCGKETVFRKLHREHIVYKINTGMTPEVKLNASGRLDWGSILAFQAENTARNEIIVNLVKKFDKRVILILTKRISQATYLIKRLIEEGVVVTSLIGSEQSFNRDARVLVGTTGKCAVGFDHDKLNTLILATDLEQYFIQALGRIFRAPNDVAGKPMVFDLVDNNSLLLKHYTSRKKVYLEHGGVISEYDIKEQ
jgi:superfamily II DNA or RNA helicase